MAVSHGNKRQLTDKSEAGTLFKASVSLLSLTFTLTDSPKELTLPELSTLLAVSSPGIQKAWKVSREYAYS